MNKRAVLVHGWVGESEYFNPKYPTASNSHWFPWLSKQLMMRNIHTVALEMPKGYYPEYDIWKKELERFEVDEDTILVGHSCGAGFLVRYLSENNVKVNKVILVAPWMGVMSEQDTKNTEPFDKTFFEFSIDENLVNKTAGITLFESTDDVDSITKSAEKLKSTISDMKVITFHNKGHFTLKYLGTEEFPELFEEIIE